MTGSMMKTTTTSTWTRVRLIRTVLAHQILHDQPPEVWQTVQRLRGDGLERDEILNQLVLVLSHEIQLASSRTTRIDRRRRVEPPLPLDARTAPGPVVTRRRRRGRSRRVG